MDWFGYTAAYIRGEVPHIESAIYDVMKGKGVMERQEIVDQMHQLYGVDVASLTQNINGPLKQLIKKHRIVKVDYGKYRAI